jgi:hypothetical protein
MMAFLFVPKARALRPRRLTPDEHATAVAASNIGLGKLVLAKGKGTKTTVATSAFGTRTEQMCASDYERATRDRMSIQLCGYEGHPHVWIGFWLSRNYEMFGNLFSGGNEKEDLTCLPVDVRTSVYV